MPSLKERIKYLILLKIRREHMQTNISRSKICAHARTDAGVLERRQTERSGVVENRTALRPSATAHFLRVYYYLAENICPNHFKRLKINVFLGISNFPFPKQKSQNKFLSEYRQIARLI
jgi:hypothetical protein